MLLRALLLLLALLIPVDVQAAGYVVQPGDTLSRIAGRYHVPVLELARANGIANANLVQAGRLLMIPTPTRVLRVKVHWGDTLWAIASRYHLSIAKIRVLNPSLGQYLLVGQWLKLCGPCGSSLPETTAPVRAPAGGATVPATSQNSPPASAYVVQVGDTLSGIASRYGVSIPSLIGSNHIVDANTIVLGTRLAIPAVTGASYYDPWQARSLIGYYAGVYGIDASLPLAVGWQESGFNQTLVSRTGAVGVMQVEPYTGAHIAQLLGRPFNLYRIDDNIHAGVYWLGQLVAYYGGNERLAAAAYYEGARAIAKHGLYRDTVQYVDNVMALKVNFGG